jgi:hypothetical protein
MRQIGYFATIDVFIIHARPCYRPPTILEGIIMKFTFAFAAALSLSLSTAAIATDAPVIKDRALVKTVDGRKVGFIDRILKNADGQPTGVQIIYGGRFVVIPAASLSAAEKGLVTSLTAKEVNKL